ncbi:hypothetical protein GA829_25955 [Mesorhizobium sp. INR15]|nr:hypothetical protein GA829_25955 [Mesorhizobium sp. INR15]
MRYELPARCSWRPEGCRNRRESCARPHALFQIINACAQKWLRFWEYDMHQSKTQRRRPNRPRTHMADQ